MTSRRVDTLPTPGEASRTTGFLFLTCPDSLLEQCYGMGREANVKIEIEYLDHNPTTVWLTNLVTGRREDVPVEDAAPFVEFLLDMVLEVGEDAGRPWRRTRPGD